ncbi:tRNA lysidine(34) synthetase TilS, partial [Ureaplasma urealyticum]
MTKLWTNLINKITNKKYLAAVSGGPDSMAMLNMYKRNISVVCHVNYHKRESADRDQEIVVDFCKKNNLPIEILDVDEKVYEKYAHIDNFQAKARLIRYDFFKEIGKKYNIQHLYIAHNFDDFLETAYMQRARQSKALFYGIKESNVVNGMIVKRPVLFIRKQTLQRYCDENKIKYGIDETNELDIYERNRVRKTISNWSLNEVYDFKKAVLKYNKEHSSFANFVELSYIEFKKNKYRYDYFVRQDDWVQYYLIYYFLIDQKISNPNENKIISLIKFFGKQINKEKAYRVQENLYMHVNEDDLISLISYDKNDVIDDPN